MRSIQSALKVALSVYSLAEWGVLWKVDLMRVAEPLMAVLRSLLTERPKRCNEYPLLSCFKRIPTSSTTPTSPDQLHTRWIRAAAFLSKHETRMGRLPFTGSMAFSE